MISSIPVVIEFAPGSRLLRQEPALGGAERSLPATFVLLSTGEQVAIPSDQVVFEGDLAGSAQVGFGGLSFEGLTDNRFVFWRVKDLVPEELQTPEERLTLDPSVVARILVQGTQVYPRQLGVF